jgi:nucleoside-diphosphate-sugar epimerase
MSKRVLVTGGGGFLGRRLVAMLLERGYRVRVLGRHHYADLADLGVDCRVGDLRDPQTVNEACRDCRQVFHVAALAGVWGRRQDFFAINAEGTQNVIRACRDQGVESLVYTSSPSVVFGKHPLAGVDETCPYPEHYLAHYPASKAMAEKAVLAANSPELATCALRPHLIWGPGDTHLIPRLLKTARSGRLAIVGPGTNLVDLTYVDNAATAHLQAAEKLTPGSAVAGQAYFIGDGKPVVLWDWINQLLEQTGLDPLSKHVSYRSAWCAGAVLEAAYRVLPLPGEPRMTRFIASQLAMSHYFSQAKAKTDFGYTPTIDNHTGVLRLVQWLQQEKKV